MGPFSGFPPPRERQYHVTFHAYFMFFCLNLRAKFPPQQLIHNLWIRLAFCFPHDLAHEKAHEFGLAVYLPLCWCSLI